MRLKFQTTGKTEDNEVNITEGLSKQRQYLHETVLTTVNMRTGQTFLNIYGSVKAKYNIHQKYNGKIRATTLQ